LVEELHGVGAAEAVRHEDDGPASVPLARAFHKARQA
ncbi:unnamed protein product, partial [Urochloa humidicola]